MGQPMALPVVMSPTGVQAVHPGAEVAVARAAAARGTAIGLSSFASKPIEEVVAANPQTFFQLYWAGPRERIAARVERARRAGAVGLIATLDWSFSNGRDWGSPTIPERLDLKTMLRFAPEVLRRPRWLAAFVGSRHLPALTVPNMALPGEPAPSFFGAYGEWMQTPPATWDDIAWLVEQWGGPFMVKGVIRVDDARAGGRRRGDRHLGVEPRRQQPRRDPRPRSARFRPSPRRSAIGSRSSSTGECAAAVTW